ncbi:hypothetical protein N7457_007701 [Penicillium paradoxum]|uniref:uncharacterized protein n=1 Tax=Penicillium paradoxum TaxID=176176 RepID=UPI0025472260|nr:uncharacterized protein N7457_007701 [Penicillium paradoxum]KAJ5772805.1 hypothetical protein N7457_007701 [Penicillium paradoxum]
MDTNEKRKRGDHETDQQVESASKQRKVIGPSLPLPREAADATNSAADSGIDDDNDDDDDDDDDFGPCLPPSVTLSVSTHPEPPAPSAAAAAADSEAKETQRDQWMLQPPSHSDWTSKVDPTQLRSRKFNTGKSATAPKNTDSSWLETPEQRMRRLQDAVMGISSSPGQIAPQVGVSNKQSVEDQIKKYKDMTGTNVRLENQGQAQTEDDDPSGRAFDREKDMALSSKISSAQRREMVKKAADYNTRFTKGNFL